jgi:osmoprotectant transport system permease protein
MGSYLRYLSENATELIFYAQQHFLLVGYSVALASVISLVLALVLHTNQLTPPSWRRSLQVGSRETALLFASAALTSLRWRCSACSSHCSGSASPRASWP